MKTILTLAIIASIALLFDCCNKEANQKNLTFQNSSNAENAVCRNKWEGQFDQIDPAKTVLYPDRRVIMNGYAHVIPPTYRKYNFFTNVHLESPDCSNINADSLRMDVSLKNPVDSPYSSTDYDVDLFIYGSTDTAHVTFVKSQQQYTSLGTGSYQLTNSAKLLHYFGAFQVLSLEAKDHVLSVYISGALKAQVNYSGTDIGRLQKILIGFKGSGYVNFVKLNNSYDNKPLMIEDFNTDGKSTDTWYQ